MQLGVASKLEAVSTVGTGVAVGSTAIVAYTFGAGPMGLSLEDAQGGTRVTISEVSEQSQAGRMGVPVGGTLMKVAGRTATGKRRAEVGKWLAAAERPLVLHILHPGGAAAARAGTASASEAEDPFAVPYKAPLAEPTNSSHPAARKKLGPISSHIFEKPGSLGFKDLQEIDEGVVISSLVPGSAASSLGVPVGGVIISVNGEDAKLQKGPLTKQMASASRPMTLLVISVGSTYLANAIAQRESRPAPEVATAAGNAVQPYTFEQPGLGFTLEEAAGGTGGVVVSHVSGAAEALGVPVGGLLVRIGIVGVSGLNKGAVGKLISKAGRPMTLYIRKGGGAAKEAAAAAAAAATAPAAAPTEEASSRQAAKDSEKKADKGTTSRGGDKGKKKGGKTTRGKATAREDKGASPAKTKRQKAEKSDWPRDKSDQTEMPETRKFSFGPGPLGLGLADGPGGKGVLVTEVAPGSAAAEMGVEPVVHVLALNGSDVTGHGKLSLSKMIGYLPRPLVVTLSVPTTPPVDESATAPAADPSQPASADADEKEKTKLRKKKSARHVKKKSPRLMEHGPSALEGATPAAAAAAAPEASEVVDGSDAAASVLPDEGAAPSEPAAARAELTGGAADPEAEVDDEESEDGEVDEEGSSDAKAAAEDASPTGGAPAESADAPEPELESKESAENDKPRRAHPPPEAPVEAFPAWCTMQPPRSPRHVKGAGAKYTLKNTTEAFSHLSLTNPAEYLRKEKPMMRRQSTLSRASAEQGGEDSAAAPAAAAAAAAAASATAAPSASD